MEKYRVFFPKKKLIRSETYYLQNLQEFYNMSIQKTCQQSQSKAIVGQKITPAIASCFKQYA